MAVALDEWDARQAASAIYKELLDTAGADGNPSAWAVVSHWAQTSQPTQTIGQLLDALSVLAVDPRCTLTVVGHSLPLALDLFLRALHRLDLQKADGSSAELHGCLYALSKVLAACPELADVLALLLESLSATFAPLSSSNDDLQVALLSLYRIANSSPILLEDADFPNHAADLLSIARSTDAYPPATRVLSLRVFARLEALSEEALQALIQKLVGSPGIKGASDGNWIDGCMRIVSRNAVVEELDVWTLPIQEHWRTAELHRHWKEEQDRDISLPTYVNDEDLFEGISTFGQRLFLQPHVQGPDATDSTFMETPSLKPSIRSFAALRRAGLPILLSGPEACGKTSLIAHACSRVSSDSSRSPIVWLQLGDQSGIDAKSLLGSFVSSTSRPGSFEWVEGALTRAVKLGKWVVLEDVDKANSEVLSVLKPLIEGMAASSSIGARPYLDLGSRGRIQAKKGFALFATRSLAKLPSGSAFPPATFFGCSHWHEIQMFALDSEDVLSIIKASNPCLARAHDDTVERMVSAWQALLQAAKSNKTNSSIAYHEQLSAGTARIPSLHDLLKWCRRTNALLDSGGSALSSEVVSALSTNQAVREDVAMEAIDIFLGASPPPMHTPAESQHDTRQRLDRFNQMLAIIADQLNVDISAMWHAVHLRKPEMKVETSSEGRKTITIGRCHGLRQARATSMAARPSSTFALTGPAARLLERIAVCLAQNEPCLIVGETGTGKTTVVQQLAAMLRKPLIALNLSQQTESGDLLGGFKPLDPKMPATDMHNIWLDLFEKTFSLRRNARYLQAERKAMQGQKWSRLVGTWRDSVKLAFSKLASDSPLDDGSEDESTERPPRKVMRTRQDGDRASPAPASVAHVKTGESDDLISQWKTFAASLDEFHAQHLASKRSLVFAFVEGPLVKAIRDGAWVLLDEINLATAETLECLSALLQSAESSVVLTERGDLEPIVRHPDFRLFACMNPATDVGKKDLPSSLRSRFTELYAPSPDSDQEALVSIVESYIKAESAGDRGAVLDVAHCFVQIKSLAREQRLADGANQRPHFSVRTLARALTFAKDTCSTYGLRRALYEGFCMAFTMLLDSQSSETVRALLQTEIMAKAKNAGAASRFIPSRPSGAEGVQHIQMGPFWLETGSQAPEEVPEYILTASVQEKLIGLARAALTRRSPVLIQGPTSAGKTSAVEYLARRTGHRFVRINNHEHTDLQEYLGTYSTDPQTGKLAFQEGLLVTAVRRGDWIVLDELNLAPTDVLEALNRLLDDNRELQLPQTGEVIKPHPHFMLFATQNPPGLYAGRKILSRAFRNRFLETHFDDVPQAELQTILANRCQIAPSYADKIVQVFLELQRRRQQERVFDTKQAFVTLRDLFRWGLREAGDYASLAVNGYMLIAERTRKSKDKLVVKEVIEQIMRVKIDHHNLYNIHDAKAMTSLLGERLASSFREIVKDTPIVWTRAMQRLVCLVACCLRYNEPVLLVGETGTGKTSVCEILARLFGRHLLSVNCHQNTDAADLLGGQRPLRSRAARRAAAREEGMGVLVEQGVEGSGASLEDVASRLSALELNASDLEVRQKARTARLQINQSLALFEWHDGPLVIAMRQGQHMLLDEISLADDSVLERLNSVLEPGRTLVLAERGSSDVNSDSVMVRALDGFQVVATMNPGGDYGKKELSPALRNRFTEVWVPAVSDWDDVVAIIDSQWTVDTVHGADLASKMIAFVNYLDEYLGSMGDSNIGLRDYIAWARFIDGVVKTGKLSTKVAFVHGALMTIIDGLPIHPLVAAKSAKQISELVTGMIAKVTESVDLTQRELYAEQDLVPDAPDRFAIGSFAIAKGNEPLATGSDTAFNMAAKTPAKNAMRVLRAMQVSNRAIMLEGSPGAGKTSLIVALAGASSHRLTRINLSDQTELSDLFGSDLPVEGGKPGEFGWRDAAFLQAMQKGEWVLLDEMNLASQSVLEGLNSCLDHRGAVYVPELGTSFVKHPDFRLFAAQNPQHQGGGRKGLPKSFLNRFTKVYVEELDGQDFTAILNAQHSIFNAEQLDRMVTFNERLQVLLHRSDGLSKAGQPWEFNLRDLLRWMELSAKDLGFVTAEGKRDPLEYFRTIYLCRFRSDSDRAKVAALASEVFQAAVDLDQTPWLSIAPSYVQIGHAKLERKAVQELHLRDLHTSHGLAHGHLTVAKALGVCIRLGLPSIVIGRSNAGKSALLRQLARLAGRPLQEVRLNSGTDTVDMIGGFEQDDVRSRLLGLIDDLIVLLQECEHSLALHQDATQPIDTVLALSKLLRQERQKGSIDWTKLEDTITALLFLDGLSQQAKESASELHGAMQSMTKPSRSTEARFAWRDGPIITALRKGQWIVLDDANLCSASVLDRLNSLLEPGGSIVLSERGVVSTSKAGTGLEIEVIYPHPNFRIFFTMDPRYGELSRAMRNRGVELYLDSWNEGHAPPLTKEASFAPSEASMQSLRPSLEACAALTGTNTFDDELSADMLFRSANSLSANLLSRLVSDDQLKMLHATLTRSVEIGTDACKTVSAQINGFLLDDLAQQPYDLQLNPQFYVRDREDIQSIVSRQLRIATRAAYTLTTLANVQRSVDGSQLSNLPVLQRSALCDLGLEADMADHEARNGFSLLKQVAVTLLQVVNSEMGTESSLQATPFDAMDAVQDTSAYIQRLWASTKRNDVGVSRIILSILRKNLDIINADQVLPASSILKTTLDSLVETLMLRTGHAMSALWKAYLPRGASMESINLADRIMQLAETHRAQAPAELISNSTELVAMLQYYRQIGDKEVKSLSDRIIGAYIPFSNASPSERTTSQHHRSDTILSAALILAVQADCGRDVSRVAQLVEFGSLPLQIATTVRATSFVKRGWSLLSPHALSWIELASTSSIVEGRDLSGSQQLFQPLVCESVVDLCMPSARISLSSWRQRQAAVLRMTQVVSALSPAEVSGRDDQSFSILPALVRSWRPHLRAAFDAANEEGEMNGEIAAIDGATEVGLLDALRGVCLSSRASLTAKSLTGDWLRMLELANDGANAQLPRQKRLYVRGSALLQFARLLLRLYVTNVPVDPLTEGRTQINFTIFRRARLEAARGLAAEVEQRVNGSASSGYLKELDGQIAQMEIELKQKQAGEVTTLSRESTVSRIAHLHAEMLAFVEQVLPFDMVKRLLASSSVSQVDSMQKTIMSVCTRFNKRYADLQDLTAPFLTGLLLANLGLGMLHQSYQLRDRSSSVARLEETAVSLASFPTTASISALSKQQDSIRLPSLIVPALLAKLKGALHDLHDGMSVQTIFPLLSVTYEQFWHLWTADEEQKRQQKLEEASLYRTRTLDIKVEEDSVLLEREFDQLFPQYGDLMDESNGAETAAALQTASKGSVVSSDDILQVFHIHLSVFSGDDKGKSLSYAEQRRAIIREVVRNHSQQFSDRLDSASAALQLELLSMASETNPTGETDRDFYLDSNSSEAGRLQALVQGVESRLIELITAFPDQHVLRDLKQRCEMILRLDFNSSVNRFLAALEGLLVHTEDWQVYASSRTSLQAQRDAMSALIIDWRRMELHGWRTLLDKEDVRAFGETHTWWFTLFQLTAKSTHGSAEEQGEVVKLIDQFLRGSPLGQFQARLSLVKSMHSYMQVQQQLSPFSEEQTKVKAILANTYAFFAQFSPALIEYRRKKRMVIEGEINDFVKLASWKDTNVHALKTSAQKTHRKLHQCLRKYRSVLNEVMDAVLVTVKDTRGEDSMQLSLTDRFAMHRQAQTEFLLRDTNAPTWHLPNTPAHLVNLQITASTLRRIMELDISPNLGESTFSENVEDLSAAIKERSQALGKATPAFLTEKNAKLVKSLEQRKRKAWSDLLKEMRRIGLNRSRVDGISTSQLSDNAFVFSLEQVEDAHLQQGTLDPLFKLLSMMPTLRGTVTSRERNEDVDVAQLQIATGYVESGMAFAVAQRQRLVDMLVKGEYVGSCLERLDALVVSHSVYTLCGDVEGAQHPLFLHKQYWIRLTSALKETEMRGRNIGAGGKDDATAGEKLAQLVGDATRQRDCLVQLVHAVTQTSSPFVTAEEQAKQVAAATLIEQIAESVQQLIVQAPAWRPFTVPLLDFVNRERPVEAIKFASTSGAGKLSSVGQASDNLISKILVVAQDVRELVRTGKGEVDELADQAVTVEGQHTASLHRALRLDEILSAIRTLVGQSDTSVQPDEAHAALDRARPFMQAYAKMLSCFCKRLASCYNAQMGLNMTVCALVTTLASRGFCKPRQEEPDQGDTDEGKDGEQLEGGVGLGEGQGAKDVTDTMEDDEEMEELQKDQNGDDGDQEDQETEREKDAREMQEDFDGKVEDVDEEGEGDEQEEDGDENEIDDAVGEVDPLDINAVDEKTWNGEDSSKDDKPSKDEKEMEGDENAEKEDEGERESGKDAEKDGANAESAGERRDERQSKEDGEGDQGEGEDEAPEQEQEQEHKREDDGDSDAGEGEDAQGDGLGRAIDEEAKQEDNLDFNLDDDLKMDEDGEDSDMADFQSISDAAQEEDHKSSFSDDGVEVDEAVGAEETAEEVENEEQEVDGEQTELPREPGGEEGAEGDQEGEEQEDDKAVAEADRHDGHDGTALDSTMQDGGADTQEAAEMGDAGQDSSMQQQPASRAHSGRETAGEQAVPETQEQDDAQAEREKAEPSRGAADSGERDGEQGDTGDDNRTAEEEESVPDRSLGDALRDFRRNLDAIEEQLSEQQARDGSGPDAEDQAKEVEHIANDEDSEMQALGAAQEEEALKRQLESSNAILDEDEVDDQARPAVDEPNQAEEASNELEQIPQEMKDEQDADRTPGRGLMASDARTADREDQPRGLDDVAESDAESDEMEVMERESDDALAEAMQAFENEADEERRMDLARELWKLYTSSTSEYAFALSEQLRLILTPTKATKLTGDFKTGKRLNMRKIIPFIASDYVKDKIWLRRHLPQKREYQVLICVDDSKSMSESHNKTLAFKSLALVCSALDRLEVGQVGVMKFGRSADLLKGFGASAGGDTVGDVQGAQILSRLPFDQRGTNVLQLLRQSLEVLTDARESHGQSSSAAGGQELWQLQIIISDGICQDHQGVRAMLRRAAEAHVMVVFVILDSLQQQQRHGAGAGAESYSSNNSILTMSSVEYKPDANGRMQLQMKRYLDTFPFEYFVVVQDAADLPDVLSATLRQWAQRIAEM